MILGGYLQFRQVAAGICLGMVGAAGAGLGGAQPINDNFADATVLVGVTNLIASNVGASAEIGEPAHAGEPAARSVWWKWTPTIAASYSVVTSNSVTSTGPRLDTTVAVYTGTRLDSLVRVVENDDTDLGEFGATWSRAVFRAYPGETFYIAIDSIGVAGNIRLSLTLAGPIMPPWQAADLQGEFIHSSDLHGKVVLVDFWETICGACVEELPDVIRVQKALSPRGFTFVGLSGDADPAVVREYVGDSRINYPIAMNNHAAEVALTGNTVGYPTKVLLDRDGRIVGRYLGGHTEAFYRSLVEPLLRPNPFVALQVAQIDGAIHLSWPGSDYGYRVEAAADPATGEWLPIESEVVASNNRFNVTFPASGALRFFRLVTP